MMEYDFKKMFGKIAASAAKIGRPIARQLLFLYYVMKESEISSMQKFWICAAMAYVLFPNDFLPRKAFGFIGITDDVIALAYVAGKVRRNITPEMIQKVDMLLDDWYGYEVEFVK